MSSHGKFVWYELMTPDVAAAGYGAGNNGFEFPLPPGTTGAITLRRSTDRAKLPPTARSQAA